MIAFVMFACMMVIWILFSWNLRVYKPFSESPLQYSPKISVLIPCRDEASTIEENILSLLKQDYPHFEVIVLDDHSTDNTAAILKRLADKNRNLRFISGKDLPEGWQGKNHACAQLAEAAEGEWLLFADADTRHEPDMLRSAMQTLLEEKADLLSTFPRQRFGSIGDELVVPLMFFILLSYLPMYFVSKRIWKGFGHFATACGQFILVRKNIYEAVGGHAALKNRISEGPLLASAVKKAGGKLILRDGSAKVSCAMYRGFRQAFRGFSRSVFASMGGSTAAVVFFLVFQTAVFILPFVYIAGGLFTGVWDDEARICLATVLIPVFMRFKIHTRIGMPLRTVVLHPFSILLYHWIMINSFVQYRFLRRTSWKGRSYGNPQT
ncbi:MAG: glycosyltransferase [Candidatus Omnitrophica bacterium]|nr:glycosyltransferase [Candidatus Omnitrophota bacterium]